MWFAVTWQLSLVSDKVVNPAGTRPGSSALPRQRRSPPGTLPPGSASPTRGLDRGISASYAPSPADRGARPSAPSLTTSNAPNLN